MASAANALSEQDNRDPDRPRITRRNRGDRVRSTPLDLEYLQRPSYCDAGFALEQISEVLYFSFLTRNTGGVVMGLVCESLLASECVEILTELCPIAAR